MLPMNFCDDWRFLSLNLGEVLGAAPWEQIPGRSSLKVNFSEEPVWFESLSLFPSWFKNWVSWVPVAFNDVSTFVKKKKERLLGIIPLVAPFSGQQPNKTIITWPHFPYLWHLQTWTFLGLSTASNKHSSSYFLSHFLWRVLIFETVKLIVCFPITLNMRLSTRCQEAK